MILVLLFCVYIYVYTLLFSNITVNWLFDKWKHRRKMYVQMKIIQEQFCLSYSRIFHRQNKRKYKKVSALLLLYVQYYIFNIIYSYHVCTFWIIFCNLFHRVKKKFIVRIMDKLLKAKIATNKKKEWNTCVWYFVYKDMCIFFHSL